MKTKLAYGLAAALIVAIAFAAPCALAGEGWGGHHKGSTEKGDHFEKMAKDLDLTSEQKDALAKYREETAPKMKDVRDRMQAAREGLRTELDKDTPDKANIAAIIEELKNLTGEKTQLMVDRVLTMKKVLTPEQSAKMRSIMEKKREEFKGKRGDREGKGHEGPPHEDM